MSTSVIGDLTEEMQDPKMSEPHFFSFDELEALKKSPIPHHIAIIPDGNRRWAMQQESTHIEGHQQGADIIIDIVRAAKELGIQAITFYAFSTENWLRPQEEVDALMWLIESYLREQKNKMIAEGIRLTTIGDESNLTESLVNTIIETKEATSTCSNIDLVLAINYGGRDEIARSVKKIINEVDKGKLSREGITEDTITQFLDTAGKTDPELMIRTSGEMRISNFLIWQLTYSEIYVADVFWPDFSPSHLYDAIIEYQRRDRRLGT